MIFWVLEITGRFEVFGYLGFKILLSGLVEIVGKKSLESELK